MSEDKHTDKTISIKGRALILTCVLAVLLLVSILAIVLLRQDAGESRLYAQIYRDDEMLDTIDLTNVDRPYQITFDYGEGDYNVVEVRQGSIGIVEASCPDKLCQKMGFIDNSLMPVTCLPNHLVIRVVTEGNADDSGLDGMTY